MTAWLEVLGRLHPLVLHAPIGLILGLAALEALGFARRDPPPQRVVSTLAWLTLLAALVALGSGLLLVREGGYPQELSLDHRNAGIAAVLVLVVMAWLSRKEEKRNAFRGALLIALALVTITGHLGGSITHGDDFLLAPLDRKPPPVRPVPPVSPPETAPTQVAAPPRTFAADIAPILANTCTGCHGEEKRKGRLAMHTREALEQGGRDGPVFVAGSSATSAMIERMRLPLDDDDHMPPGDKPQPTAEQVALIAAWIDAGAPFEGGFAFEAGETTPAELPNKPAEPPTTPDSGAVEREDGDQVASKPEHVGPDAAAIDALRSKLVHVQAIADGDSRLWIDFAAPAADVNDGFARSLLEPVAAHVAQLSLARTAIGDDALDVVARMPQLHELDLRATAVTDAGLTKLAGAAELRELNVSQTTVSDASVELLAALPKLERLFVWRSKLSDDGIARLRSLRPSLSLDAGDAPPSAALEVEPAFRFTNEAPLPGAENAVAALAPVNTTCPVSGSPVNPKYAVVFEGKVVGFCCPNCPKEFWADPAKFADELARQ